MKFYERECNANENLVMRSHRNGVTQVELAKAFGVTQQQISKIFRGEAKMTINQLFVASEMFGVPVTEMVAPPPKSLEDMSVEA